MRTERRLAVLFAGAFLAIAVTARGETGLEIMQRYRELHRPSDEEEHLVMELVNEAGATKQREIVRYTRKGDDDLSKLLFRFLAPRDVEGTGLLTWESKAGDDDQWLFLPATRKAKRIAASGKKNRFMGTDYSYEDLRPENLELHRYEIAGAEAVDGHECWVIDAHPATEKQADDSGYSRRKLWMRKDVTYPLKREYYDPQGKLRKVETMTKLVNPKGTLWRADEMEMKDVVAGTRTILRVKSRKVDQGLDENFFTETELTRTEL